MKAPLLILITCVIFFASCTKTDIASRNNSVFANSTDNATILKTRSALLTAHAWKYQGFYFHYVDKNNKGDVQYQRGRSNNLVDLDATRYYFKPDGTFVEIDGGYRFNGTWHFTDNTAAVLFLDFKTWTETCTITNFTSNHLNYTEPMGYHALSFTELIPVQ